MKKFFTGFWVAYFVIRMANAMMLPDVVRIMINKMLDDWLYPPSKGEVPPPRFRRTRPSYGPAGYPSYRR